MPASDVWIQWYHPVLTHPHVYTSLLCHLNSFCQRWTDSFSSADIWHRLSPVLNFSRPFAIMNWPVGLYINPSSFWYRCCFSIPTWEVAWYFSYFRINFNPDSRCTGNNQNDWCFFLPPVSTINCSPWYSAHPPHFFLPVFNTAAPMGLKQMWKVCHEQFLLLWVHPWIHWMVPTNQLRKIFFRRETAHINHSLTMAYNHQL